MTNMQAPSLHLPTGLSISRTASPLNPLKSLSELSALRVNDVGVPNFRIIWRIGYGSWKRSRSHSNQIEFHPTFVQVAYGTRLYLINLTFVLHSSLPTLVFCLPIVSSFDKIKCAERGEFLTRDHRYDGKFDMRMSPTSPSPTGLFIIHHENVLVGE